MSRKIYAFNPDLKFDQRVDNPVIDIYQVNDADLLEHDWIYDNLWPKDKFIQLIFEIRARNPLVIADNPMFWDQGTQGYNVYNHAIEELSQIEGL